MCHSHRLPLNHPSLDTRSGLKNLTCWICRFPRRLANLPGHCSNKDIPTCNFHWECLAYSHRNKRSLPCFGCNKDPSGNLRPAGQAGWNKFVLGSVLHNMRRPKRRRPPAPHQRRGETEDGPELTKHPCLDHPERNHLQLSFVPVVPTRKIQQGPVL